MYFTNLSIFKLTSPIQHTAEEIELALHEKPFVPCGKLDSMRVGFVSPIEDGAMLTHVIGGYVMVCMKREEKLMPASVIASAVNERVKEIRKEEGRPVGRAERTNLKDEFIFMHLPTALSTISLTHAYIDTVGGWVIVNSSSATKAEDVISALREVLGGLRCIPLRSALPAACCTLMTQWLKDGSPDEFSCGMDYVLEDIRSGQQITYKNTDASSEDVISNLNAGMMVMRLAMDYIDRASFTLDTSVTIKRLKFSLSVLLAEGEQREPETLAEQFDADFALMTGEVRDLLDDLVAALGGLEYEEDTAKLETAAA